MNNHESSAVCDVPMEVLIKPNDYMNCYCSNCCKAYYVPKVEYQKLWDEIIDGELCEFCSDDCRTEYKAKYQK